MCVYLTSLWFVLIEARASRDEYKNHNGPLLRRENTVDRSKRFFNFRFSKFFFKIIKYIRVLNINYFKFKFLL